MMDEMEFGGFMVNVIMMIIAIASSLISYLVYKENSSPDIIVYIEQDKHAPTVLNLVIKNIGKSAAKDITFEASEKLPQKAFFGEKSKVMYEGPLISGIPFLAPDVSRISMLGNYAGLSEWFKEKKITVDITFYKANPKSLYPKAIKNRTYLDIYSFLGVSASDNSVGNKMLGELKKIEKAILYKSKV
ncbi:Putative phage-related protein [Erwinia billingiae Eb661]|uniref:Putative phage-related protein n=1 Tax=Erwinia billingiae (strain Eb661) TaxID=634500 RepID=D8MXC4_ERWBE|nr:hypothetical protein [Erwinia billingiae]CAX61481.1 Putative phage-related protein [Erwinia billingiae Eb661]